MKAREWIEEVGGVPEGVALGDRYGIPPLAGRLLAHSGMGGEELEAYLNISGLGLPDPFRLPDMDRAARRVARAARGGERVLVHGDYDVDGLMGTAILAAGLRSLGADAKHHIPSRFDGGYGLSETSLAAAREFGASLVVTADCGTNPGTILDEFASCGMEVVVTDHHIPQPGGPRADIFVNAHGEEGHPDADLCGASVAMQLVRAVAAEMGRELRPEPFLRLAALATVADVVPMTLTNRFICRSGLPSLLDSPSPALSQLCRRAGIYPPVRSCHVGYGLAPRFNAAGRMQEAGVVVEMLLERERAAAARYVDHLEAMNAKRKAQQAEAYEAASRQAQASHGARALVVALDEGRFRGVVGPVAARLAEHYDRSAFVMALEGEEYTGSARSANGDDVTDLLSRCSDHLVRFGGHGSAAGFTLEKGSLEAFLAALERVPRADHTPRPGVYHRIGPDEAGDMWEAWGVLDPFGPGNEEPFLGLAGFAPKKVRTIKGRHLAWEVDLPSGPPLTCIRWGAIEDGCDPSWVRSGRTFVGTPVPESRPGPMSHYFQVREILG